MVHVCLRHHPAELSRSRVRAFAQRLLRVAAACAVVSGVVPAQNASAAILQQVQSGTTTSSGNGTVTVTIAAADMTKSFLIFQTRSDSGVPGGSTVRGRLQTSTTLEFQRVTSDTSVITIQWYVATFGSGVTVQRGEV